MKIYKYIVIIAIFTLTYQVKAQQIKKVLFLGNSYTQVNNLPQLVHDIAKSRGDSLFFDSNTPGGCTLQQHSTNSTSLSKINSNNWDYVVLQEQSQLPSFSPSQVQTDVLPYADTLNNKIKANDSCTTTIFYMTWGRQNGDASNCATYPPICTYSGMQQRLRDSYLLMGQMFGAEVCPGGVAWKRVRDTHPTMSLYQPDESHPTTIGSYLIACTFYASIFHKSPIGASAPSGVTLIDALILQQIADSMVFDSLIVWGIDTSTVNANFTYNNSGSLQIQFNNNSANATSYFWDFGDGTTSSATSPNHTFPVSNVYNVMLIAKRNCDADTTYQQINLSLGINENQNNNNDIFIYPVPAKDYITINGNITTKEQNIKYSLYNSQGILLNTKLISGKSTIDVSNLPAGIYCLKFYQNNIAIKNIRFIKI